MSSDEKFEYIKIGEKQESRDCANCACSLLQEKFNNPMESQMFCRRNTPTYGVIEAERPRLDKEKKVAMGRDGKPIMERVQQEVYVYPPVKAELVCFDGWRPKGTLPGVVAAK